MGLLDDGFVGRFSPKARFAPKDNTKELSSMGDYCFACNVPIEECEGHD